MESAARTFARLRQLNARTSGIELRALSALADMAPRVEGEPQLIGPYDRINEGVFLPTVRTIGYRKTEKRLPPFAHAKLALLGTINWTDEHPAGGVDDYIWVQAVAPVGVVRELHRCLASER